MSDYVYNDIEDVFTDGYANGVRDGLLELRVARYGIVMSLTVPTPRGAWLDWATSFSGLEHDYSDSAPDAEQAGWLAGITAIRNAYERGMS